jgi:hypothetical protein
MISAVTLSHCYITEMIDDGLLLITWGILECIYDSLEPISVSQRTQPAHNPKVRTSYKRFECSQVRTRQGLLEQIRTAYITLRNGSRRKPFKGTSPRP